MRWVGKTPRPLVPQVLRPVPEMLWMDLHVELASGGRRTRSIEGLVHPHNLCNDSVLEAFVHESSRART